MLFNEKLLYRIAREDFYEMMSEKNNIIEVVNEVDPKGKVLTGVDIEYVDAANVHRCEIFLVGPRRLIRKIKKTVNKPMFV